MAFVRDNEKARVTHGGEKWHLCVTMKRRESRTEGKNSICA